MPGTAPLASSKHVLTLFALLAIAGPALAAVSLSYGSNQATIGVRAAPITFSAGVDTSSLDYVPSFALSTNGTTVTFTLRGVAEVPVSFSDLARITNHDTRVHTITLSTDQITNSFVTAYRFDVYDGSTLVGSLDMKSAAPSLTLADMPAGKTYTVRATLSLASGAGNDNVADTRAIAIGVSS